jgi:hypothetical protein
MIVEPEELEISCERRRDMLITPQQPPNTGSGRPAERTHHFLRRRTGTVWGNGFRQSIENKGHCVDQRPVEVEHDAFKPG